MQDRFKFRVWSKEQQKLYSWDDLKKSKGDNSFYWCMLQAQNDEKNNILMQSVGLKDKNGKVIYEGDIIKICCCNLTKTQISDVFFCQERSAFCFHYKTDYGDYANCTMEKTETEVIGNIYEDSHLIENSNNLC